MRTAVRLPASRQKAAPDTIGRRAAAFRAHGHSAPVVNMGLEEIQKQAKAS